MAWKSNLENVRTCLALETFEGDELFGWYGNAGYGAPTREEGEASLRAFVTSYGFNPWE